MPSSMTKIHPSQRRPPNPCSMRSYPCWTNCSSRSSTGWPRRWSTSSCLSRWPACPRRCYWRRAGTAASRRGLCRLGGGGLGERRRAPRGGHQDAYCQELRSVIHWGLHTLRVSKRKPQALHSGFREHPWSGPCVLTLSASAHAKRFSRPQRSVCALTYGSHGCRKKHGRRRVERSGSNTANFLWTSAPALAFQPKYCQSSFGKSASRTGAARRSFPRGRARSRSGRSERR